MRNFGNLAKTCFRVSEIFNLCQYMQVFRVRYVLSTVNNESEPGTTPTLAANVWLLVFLFPLSEYGLQITHAIRDALIKE